MMAVLSVKYYILLSISFVFSNGGKQEPVCSRFHYEEMLLEKMVRLEHSTNLMMEEFREIRAKVDNNLAAVKKATENMKTVLDLELGTQRNASIEIKQKTEHAVEEMKAKLQRSSYAFSAYWLDGTSLSNGETPIFKKTLLDEDGLYDAGSGKYRVPVSGIYYFTAGLCVNKGDFLGVNIVADGVRIGAFDAVDYDIHTCSSGSAVAKLYKNTKVWLVVTEATNQLRNNDGVGGFNYFSGYLINEQ